MSSSRTLGRSWIESYLQYTSATEPSETFRLWAALTTISSVLQRKVWITMGSLTWYPNLYTLLVGAPAARKSTTLHPIYDLLRDADLDLKFTSDKGSTVDVVLDMQRAERPFYIEGKQFIQSPLVVLSSEFAVFMKKEMDGQIFDLLCKSFDCDPSFEYGTASRGKKRADGPVITLLGCTTPESLMDTLPDIAIGGGFSSRFIMVYGKPIKKIAAWKTSLVSSLTPKLVADLRAMHELTGPMIIDDSYKEIYEPWYEKSPNPPHLDNKLFAYYCERRATHLNKIAAIFSIAESDSLVLTAKHFKQALSVLEGAEATMPRIFQDFRASKDMKVYDDIKDYIELHKETTFTVLLREFWKKLPEPAHDKLEKFIETAKQARWIQTTGSGPHMKITLRKRNDNRTTGKTATNPNGVSSKLHQGLFEETLGGGEGERAS